MCESLWAWFKPSVSFLLPRIVERPLVSSRIAIGPHLNRRSGRALSFVRLIACPCRKWRGARASADFAVWRWQARYAEQGVEGVRCATGRVRRARFRPRSPPRLCDLTCSETARLRHALDWPRHGQSRRRPACAPCSACGRRIGCSRTVFPYFLLQRSRVRREGRGHRRPLAWTRTKTLRWTS